MLKEAHVLSLRRAVKLIPTESNTVWGVIQRTIMAWGSERERVRECEEYGVVFSEQSGA